MPREPKFTVCYVTESRALAHAAGDSASRAADSPPAHVLLQNIRRAAAAGVDWIQIRERELQARTLAELVRLAVAQTRRTGTTILVNDRLDIALAAGATGVHLGEKSLPVEAVVDWRRRAHRMSFRIGASCHSAEAACTAERAGADYVLFGPVFATPSKAAFGAPQGIERLREACAAVRIPVLAIGGISTENAASCRAAGAAGVAAIRLFQESADIAAVLRRLRTSGPPMS